MPDSSLFLGDPFLAGGAGAAPVTDHAMLRRGLLALTDAAGIGWYTAADGKVVLVHTGTQYQIMQAPTRTDVLVLVGAFMPVAGPQWPWEEVSANGNILTFRVSTDGYRWTTLYTVDVTLLPSATTTAIYSGLFVQGSAQMLLERSAIN